jgi:5-methyltetrahydropteroyltriglutamate--homocysteine methyltransferase
MPAAHPVEDLNLLRVDQVGSLVVPADLAAASDRRLRGEMSEGELRETEDKAIRAVMRKQEQVGLPILTDGEFRRRNFQDSFGNAVSGYDTPQLTGAGFRDPQTWRDPNKPGSRTEPNYEAAGPAIATRRATVERLKLKKNVVLDEYKAAAAMTERPVKVSLIGPDRIAQRFAWEKSKAVYSGLDEFIADVVAIQRRMIGELVDAGCRYVHMDAPGFTAYVDKTSLERMKARGEDPEQNLDRAIRAENAVIEGFPGVTFGLHICRGNPRGVDASGKVQAQWHREGHYDSIAEKLFSGLKHQRLLLEYDSERSGSFDALRFVRKGTVAVLGVVTTKSEQIEQVDAMKRRVEMAAKYLPVEQLAVSPQCGFSSGIGVPQLSEDAEWRKFEILIKTAEAVWGHV